MIRMAEATRKMKAVLVEPLKKPHIVTIPAELCFIQEMIGSHIEATYPWDDEVALVSAEEGKFDGSMPNRVLEDYDIIFGPFLICGLTKTDFGSLSDELAEKYMEKFKYPEMIMGTQNGQISCIRMEEA